MNEKIPKQLSHRQELQRQHTANLVIRAVSDLQSLGGTVKIKDLMDVTGLSRSVFAKPHVRAVLEDAGIIDGMITPKKTKPHTEPSQQSAVEVLRDKLDQKDKYIAELLMQNSDLKRECELLRGQLFLMMQKDG